MQNGIGFGASVFGIANSLIAAAEFQESKLTAEERAERKERRRLMYEERVRKSKIVQNICPDCDGKLVRGKKDKKNDYKRVWVCRNCGSSHNT